MDDRTFITSNLPLAAYLLTVNALALREIRPTNPGSVELVFDDPEGKGPEIECKFLTGATVPALLYSQQFRSLRQTIDARTSAATRSGVNGRNSNHKGRNSNVHFTNSTR